MTTLILMRHAKSSWSDPHLSDHDRPLNARGVASATAMGDWLRSTGHLPDLVLSSTALRTQETAANLQLGCPTVFDETLYHADTHTILTAIRRHTADNLLVLGHNPGFAGIAAQMVKTAPRHPKFAQFPTCATLVLTFPDANLASIQQGTGTVIDFAVPREVMQT